MSFSILPAVGSGGIVGFMFGLLGGGGSILATPLLLYVVGIAQPHIAIGTGVLRRRLAAPAKGRSKILPLNMAMAAYFSNYLSCEVRPQ
ncbi:hypothetical protein Rhsp01_57750 [Rhizobium sp. NBRC 114257]|uniref:Membrane transporter protein n=1 Tax=Rhizobium dioscoreae TaxID=2653122 RepID=A0ABQ0ZCA5_9HYPH|nr:hypothetical protein [Rhizobium sp. NBRC 114257]GES53160.1 hypothetical protein RsS93_57740 [Rhizobium dioscoreae]GLU84599.1 hypothetical protein Rhsp01_57750 [Rhizobium sp. NBRC 114257]